MIKNTQNNNIELGNKEKEYMISLIKDYFAKERGENIGDLASDLILEFIKEKIAPAYYNQGIADAYKYIDERLEEVFSIQK